MDKAKVELGKGSFVPAAAIQDKIEAHKAATQINQASTDADKAKDDAKEVARLKEIDDLLPKEVFCSVGKLSFDTFRQRYKTVWEQVANKDHLARGHCVFTHEIAPSVKVIYRTLRGNEMRFLSRMAPSTSATVDRVKFSDEGYQFRLMRVILGVTEWDSRALSPLPIPTLADRVEDWLVLPDVSARMKMFEGLPEELLDLMAGILSDVSNAYHYALQENLKNQ